MADASFAIPYFTLTLLTFVCHIIGLVVSLRVKSPTAMNQRIIAINLALTEILFCANQLAFYAGKNIVENPSIPLVKMNQTLQLIVHTANKLIMIHLTFDRFTDIYLHLKYALPCLGRVIKILAAVWIISIVYGIVLGIIMEVMTPPDKYPKIQILVNNYVSFVVDTLLTLSAVGSYSYLFYKVRNIMARNIISNNTQKRSGQPK